MRWSQAEFFEVLKSRAPTATDTRALRFDKILGVDAGLARSGGVAPGDPPKNGLLSVWLPSRTKKWLGSPEWLL